MALSIVQWILVGLAHFSVGYILFYVAFFCLYIRKIRFILYVLYPLKSHFFGEGDLPSSSWIRLVSFDTTRNWITVARKRKGKVGSGTKISLDSSILKKRNKWSSIVEWEMGNSWKVTIPINVVFQLEGWDLTIETLGYLDPPWNGSRMLVALAPKARGKDDQS